jgi:ATP-dependent RNA helicase DDX54/DBP10
MAPHKKHARTADPESSSDHSDISIISEDEVSDEDAIDISLALTGNRKRKHAADGSDEAAEDDDDLEFKNLIKDSIAKRDMKKGTEVIKHVKGGRYKLSKGEVGGGSFQSMGALSYSHLPNNAL